MTALPSSLSLANIADGAPIVASDHRNNYSAIQTALNALIAVLAAGSNNQLLESLGGANVQWEDPPSSGSVPAGAMSAYAAASAPSGWLLCDGSAVSRVTYAALYAVTGNTYGAGDGSTTFNLPDMRGRGPVGYAAAGGHTDVSALANNDGAALASRRPKHTHDVTPHNSTTGPGASGSLADDTTVTSTVNGPAYLVVNWIVKT